MSATRTLCSFSSLKITWILFLGLVLFPNSIVSLRYRPGIIQDEYGNKIDLSLCPSKEQNPNISVLDTGSLVCLAPYPITIHFKGFRPTLHQINLNLLNATPKDTDSSTPCYLIQIPNYSRMGEFGFEGQYNCTSTTDPKKSSSLFLFRNANQPGFVTSLVPKPVYINKNNITKLMIPCPAARVELTKAVLFRFDEITTQPVEVKSIRHWDAVYDQKVGFEVTFPVTKVENATNVVGKYVCRDPLDLSESEISVFHTDYIVYPSRSNVTFNRGTLTLECYSGEPVTIEIVENATGNLKVIETRIDTQPPPFQTLHDAGFVHYAKMTFGTEDSHAKGQIVCKNSSSKVPLFVWNFDNEYICKCNWSELQQTYYHGRYGQAEHEYGEDPIDDSVSSRPYLGRDDDWMYYDNLYAFGRIDCQIEKAQASTFSTLLIPCTNPIECSMVDELFLSNENYNNQTTDYLRGYFGHYGSTGPKDTNMTTINTNLQTGKLLCEADGFSSELDVRVDMDKKMYFNEEPKSKDALEIHVGEKYFYAGDQITFLCRSLGFGILGPMLWAFEYQNGTKEYISFNGTRIDRRGIRIEDHVRQDQVGRYRTSALTIRENTKKIWCYAPKWNSTQWAYTSIDMNVEVLPPADNPPTCPTGLKPWIVMDRKSRRFPSRKRMPHLVTGRDLELHSPLDSVSLFCLAKYPVVWMKDGVNVVSTKSTRVNCKGKDGKVVQNSLAKAVLTVSLSAANSTGNYTCKPALTRNRAVSTYIYAIGDKRPVFVNEGHHYQVFHKMIPDAQISSGVEAEWDKWAVLPCRTNQPKLIPYLFVDPNTENQEPRKVPMSNEYLKFDPKIGFSVDVTSGYTQDETTTFICSDHKDGSFIGNLITLHKIHDRNLTSTTTFPTVIVNHGTNGTTTVASVLLPKPTTTEKPVSTSVMDSGSSSGFVISIVLLVSLCLASFATIFRLYQKLTREQKSVSPTHELEWTNAIRHCSADSIIPVGNNVANLIEADSLGSSNNAHNNTLNNQDSIANNLYDNDFNYKKF